MADQTANRLNFSDELEKEIECRVDYATIAEVPAIESKNGSFLEPGCSKPKANCTSVIFDIHLHMVLATTTTFTMFHLLNCSAL